MRFRILVFALVAMGLVCAGPSSARPVDREQIRVRWDFAPEVTRSHPKKAVIAYVVTKKHKLYDIGIAYSLGRYPERGPKLEPGGRVVANLEILQGDRTIDFGTIKKKPETWSNGYVKFAEVRWNDPSGNEVVGWTDQLTDLLPLPLEPGDVVVWTVKMKGFPKLERWSDLVEEHLDEAHLTTDHCNCGSKDRPCPDWN